MPLSAGVVGAAYALTALKILFLFFFDIGPASMVTVLTKWLSRPFEVRQANIPASGTSKKISNTPGKRWRVFVTRSMIEKKERWKNAVVKNSRCAICEIFEFIMPKNRAYSQRLGRIVECGESNRDKDMDTSSRQLAFIVTLFIARHRR